MNLFSRYSIALRSLLKNKLQTSLTMLGMTIGVATVMTMIALGSGAQKSIQDQVRAAGMNMITVKAGNYQVQRVDDTDSETDESGIRGAAYSPATDLKGKLDFGLWNPKTKMRASRVFIPARLRGKIRPGDFAAGLGAAETLSLQDAEAIRQMPGVQYVSSGYHDNINLTVGNRHAFTRLHGDDVTIADIRRAWVFRSGRFFKQKEVDGQEKVAILGSYVSNELFGDEDPVGKQITIKDQPFKIIGVVGSSTWMVPEVEGDDQFDAIYIPITTQMGIQKVSYLSTITITTVSTGDVSPIRKKVMTLLRQRHHITDTMPDDFVVNTQASKTLTRGGVQTGIARAVIGNIDQIDKVTLDQLGKTLDRASRTMTYLLTSIATVSMIVGGIGIMNIMLLSVTERITEIGIRRAVGARSNDVMYQFLFESVTLSLVGGVLGIILGVLISFGITHWARWSTHISQMSILVSFGISAAIGIFFGYYPARQASLVTPMDALRHE